MNSYRVFVILLVAAFFSGCVQDPPTVPSPNTGSTIVTKYVAIGNSLTAGYQSNGLYQSAQLYSFPNLIAQQLRTAGASIGNFEQPYYSDPGTPGSDGKASRYEIISLAGPVIGPRGLAPGSPINLALARPYDNLGIPGIVIASFLDQTNFTSNPLVPLVLRNSAGFPNSVFGQVKLLRPDLVTFWLGNNDVLGYATSGGVSPSSPTPSVIFAALYSQAMDSLRSVLPTAKIVVANIPNVTAIPFFTTVGPKMAAGIPAGVYLRYQKHGNASVAFDSTRLTETNAPFIPLTGSAYTAYLGKGAGQGGGKWYRDKNYPALPAGIDTSKPFGFHPQNPWPDALVLDLDEQVTAGNAVNDFNNTIRNVAAAKGAVLVDINGFFNGVKAHHYFVAGQEFTADYVSGGLFSLDGVHPSSRGAGIIANEFIKVMNSSFGMNIPLVDISTIPGITAPLSKQGSKELVVPVIPLSAFKDLDMLWGK